ncbi:MAG: type II toxin-antitoxin system VapC family toxin [Terriglobales bacterium]
MTAYADSSVLTSFYAEDVHTPKIQRWLEGRPRLWLTPLHAAEIAHALERQVFYRQLSPRESIAAWADLQADRGNGIYLLAEVSPAAFARCAELALHYAARLNPRTLDSLHVACALELGAREFWTFDARQAELARAAGLAIHGAP